MRMIVAKHFSADDMTAFGQPIEHMRSVITDGPDVRMDCSCGYLSAPFVSVREALSATCPVEEELRTSAWRRERWEREREKHTSCGLA